MMSANACSGAESPKLPVVSVSPDVLAVALGGLLAVARAGLCRGPVGLTAVVVLILEELPACLVAAPLL